MNTVQTDIRSIIRNKELFEFMRDSAVLVTGATGFIGSMLVKTLLEAEEEYGLGIKIIGQIRDIEKARAVFGNQFNKIQLTGDYEMPFRYVFHTISPTRSKFFIEHPVETIKSSVESTMEMLEAAKKNGASVLYLSSMEEYGVPYEPGQVMTEDKVGIIDHLNTRSSYSESKRLCECLCASYASEYGVDVKMARLAQTVGAGAPLSDNRMPMQFARAAAEGEDIVLHTEGRTVSNFIYLTDAVRGLLTILDKGASGEAYNVCNDKETRRVRDIAELVVGEVAEGKIGVKVEILDNTGFAPDNEMYLNSDKLRSLGWDAEVGMAEAYGRLAKYIKEQ